MRLDPLAPLLALALLVSAAPQQKTKEEKVRKLMLLTGAADSGKQTLDAMMDQFGKIPNLPAGFVKKFKELARPQELVELVVPIYMKHVDEPTLDAAIAFHESEAGRKMLKIQPAILKESMEAGQQWGEELAKRVLKSLDEEKEKDK